MSGITHIGIDLAKTYFHVFCGGCAGQQGAPEATPSARIAGIHGKHSEGNCSDGGLWECSFLGSEIRRAWTHSEAHSS